MEYASGKQVIQVTTYEGLLDSARKNLPTTLHGAVHNIRDMGDFAFVIIRIPAGLVQCFWDKSSGDQSVFDLIKSECTVEMQGSSHEEPRAPGGVEVRISSITLLSSPAEDFPINI